MSQITPLSSSDNLRGGSSKKMSAMEIEMVSIVKEIVKNCSDDEILAMLNECNMNPNDAVHKLLYQDHFHEVKSRREKKKEIKEASEFRSQSGTSTRNLGRGGSVQYRTVAPEPSRGRSVYKEEYSSTPVTSSVPSVSSVDGFNYTPQSVSDSFAQGQRIGNGDISKSTSQSSAESQSVWSGVSHPLTMADVVKMGRVPANHLSNPTTSTGTPYGQHGAVFSNVSHESVQDRSSSASLPEEMVDELLSSEDPVLEDSNKNHESGLDVGQHVQYNEWPFVEQSAAASGSSIWKSSTSRGHTDPSVLSNMQTRMATLNLDSQSDDLQVAGDAIFERHGIEHNEADSISNRHRGFDNESYNIVSSYAHRSLNNEGRAGNGQSSVPNYSSVKAYDDSTVPSASSALQQPRFRKDEFEALSSVNSHTLTLPNNLQVPTSNISSLSFGSYGSHNNTSYSRPSVSEDASSTEQFNSRNPEIYGQERDSFYTTADGALDRNSSQYPQSDVAAQRHQYSSILPGYTREKGSQLNAVQTNSQETLVNSLTHNMWTSQESEYLYADTLNKIQALSRNGMSSNPEESEYLYTNTLNKLQALSRNAMSLNTERVPTSVYPISEPNAYTPFASQSKYMANNNNAAYQASTLAHEIALNRALLQLRNTQSINNLPHLSAGYSSLANFATSHGRNSSATPTIDHYDILSQYNNSHDSPPVSQSERSVRWAGGLGSRTMPSPSVRQDYNFQVQKSQSRRDSGYLDHSRVLQEQILRERILGSSQVGSFQQYQEKVLRERILGNSQVPPRYSQSGQFWEH